MPLYAENDIPPALQRYHFTGEGCFLLHEDELTPASLDATVEATVLLHWGNYLSVHCGTLGVRALVCVSRSSRVELGIQIIESEREGEGNCKTFLAIMAETGRRLGRPLDINSVCGARLSAILKKHPDVYEDRGYGNWTVRTLASTED